MTWYSYLAILITVHQIIILFYSIGHVVPVRYLFGALMALQMLFGPMLAYSGLDKFQVDTYQMKVSESVYFSYAIPAVVCFILGLHLFAGRLKGEIVDIERVTEFVTKYTLIPYVLIVIGFFSSIISEMFSTDFNFVFYLLGSFKFVGLFLIILGNERLKIFPLLIVYSSVIISSLGQGMFHDLLTWLIFLGAVLALKYKPNNYLKLIVLTSFILFVVIIQVLKGDYRSAVWQKGEEGGINTISNTVEERSASNTLFDFKSLATSNVRINQGYIISNIMVTVPAKIPFAEGDEMIEILTAAFLPRILAPDKLTAGNRDLFMKYSGMRIGKRTSMGLSSVGDAYINFGIVGGCIFMFVLGLFYSGVLNTFHKLSKSFPVLLVFTALAFYYPIRPDCELQTILGHLVKSCFLIFVIFFFWNRYFRVKSKEVWKRFSY